jgi:hypothetical protein
MFTNNLKGETRVVESPPDKRFILFPLLVITAFSESLSIDEKERESEGF